MGSAKETTEEREVLTPLTEEEARKLMTELAETDRALLIMYEEKSEMLSEFNQRKKPLEARRAELVGVVLSKQEKRTMKCRVVMDFEVGMKYVFSPFIDGLVIEQIALTDDERQMQFPKLEAGQPVEEEEPGGKVVDAEIVQAGYVATCADCEDEIRTGENREPEEEGARKIEVRQGGELVETLFVCAKCAPEHCKGCGTILRKQDQEFGICAECDKKQAVGAEG